MLTPMTAGDWNVCADAAWRLACSLKTSGFPTYLDGVKTRADFDRKARQGLADERDTLLTFARDGAARGYIHAYFLPEDRYASTCFFLTEDGWQGAALAAFTAWARERWPGARLDLGFPEENEAACARDARAEGAKHLCHFAEEEDTAAFASFGFRRIAGYAAFTARL